MGNIENFEKMSGFTPQRMREYGTWSGIKTSASELKESVAFTGHEAVTLLALIGQFIETIAVRNKEIIGTKIKDLLTGK